MLYVRYRILKAVRYASVRVSTIGSRVAVAAVSAVAVMTSWIMGIEGSIRGGTTLRDELT